jgi:hypothetical protein
VPREAQRDLSVTPEQLIEARKVAAISPPGSGVALLVAHIDAQAAEIKQLRAMLQKARGGLSCGLWDYGPGQSEHDQCDELIAEIDVTLKGAK